MTAHPCGRCDRCAEDLKLCAVHDGQLWLPDDPWLIDYIFEDEGVDLTLWAQLGNDCIIYDIDRIDDVVKVLESHEENCLMQDSPKSAAFINGIIVGIQGLKTKCA